MKPKFCTYRQVTSERDVTSTNFTNGEINMPFRLDSRTCWNPSKSFLKMRVKLFSGKDSLAALDLQASVAPNQYLGHSLFKQMYFQINGTNVSQIDDYCAQIGSLKSRMMYSDQQRKTLLSSTNFADADFNVRKNAVSRDGKDIGKDSYEFYRRNVIGLTDSGGTAITIASTFSLAVDTGILTIAVAVPDIRQIFQVGDIIEIDVGDLGTDIARHVVKSISTGASATTIRLDNVKTLAPGAATTLVNPVYLTRRKASRKLEDFEILFKPPMGIFDVDAFLPGADYVLKMQPHGSTLIKQYAVESLRNSQPRTVADASSATGNTDTYEFEVVSMELYICQGEIANPSESQDVGFSFQEIRAQMQNVTSNSLLNKTFTVNDNTKSLTLAFQSENAQSNDTRRSISKFAIANDEHLNLTRFYIQYNGVQLPNPIPDLDYSSGASLAPGVVDYTAQRYYESLLYSGQNYLDSVESLQDWQLSPYYHFKWPRSEGKEYTERVYVSCQFSTLTGRPNMILFDHFDRAFKLHIRNGRVQKVEVDTIN